LALGNSRPLVYASAEVGLITRAEPVLWSSHDLHAARVAFPLTDAHIAAMCGRVIQSGGPLRYAIVDGMNVRDSRVHNYPPRWNAAPSQELLVIRRNHKTGEVSLDPAALGADPVLVQ
jgi:hypothetical protein